MAYAVKDPAPVGTSTPCGDSDSMAGVYVGGIGGEGGGGMTMPEGAAFRLPKNHGILLNAHFVNVTKETLTGQSVLDVQFAEVDPTRKVMSLFTNMDLGFELKPRRSHEQPSRVHVPEGHGISYDWQSHAPPRPDHHDRARDRRRHPDRGAPRGRGLDSRDGVPSRFSQWTTATPLVVKKGDTVRTRCTWMNESAEALRFPTEMCIGIGFFLSDGTSSPACMNGAWLENGATLR